jgi:hypothetical protein
MAYDTPTPAQVAALFGAIPPARMAEIMRLPLTTVCYWRQQGRIPRWHMARVKALASRRGIVWLAGNGK